MGIRSSQMESLKSSRSSRMGSSGGVANGFVEQHREWVRRAASRMGLAASRMGSSGGVTNGFVGIANVFVGVANVFGVGVFGRLISLWFVTAEIKKRRDKMKRSKGSIYTQVFSDENVPLPMPFKFVAKCISFLSF